MAGELTASPIKRRYGWRPDVIDGRDRCMLRRSIGNLPERVDMRPECSPMDDQGLTSSCTGHAIAGALELYAQRRGAAKDFSRLFIYYEERRAEHTIRSDGGAMIRTGIKVCAKIGAALEKAWPFVPEKLTRKPTVRAYADAARHRVASYARVPTLDTMLAVLAGGDPVVFGFSVYDGFESDEVARTGVASMPNYARERCLGGHAVVAVGYDYPARRLLCRNSWGAAWGLGGYFWLPFGFWTERTPAGQALADDAWSLSPA